MLKRFLLVLFFGVSAVNAGGIPVYDPTRHIYDTVRDVLQFAQDVENLTSNAENLSINKEIRGINDDIRTFQGWAKEFGIDTSEIGIDDVLGILKEAESTSKDVEKVRKRNEDVFGTVDRSTHTISKRPTGIDAYKHHDKKRQYFKEYITAYEGLNEKKIRIIDEIQSLSEAVDAATTDAEIRKYNASILAHQAELEVIKQQEDALYRKYQMELKNMENDQKERDITATREKERLYENYLQNNVQERVERGTQLLEKKKEDANSILDELIYSK